MAVEIAGGSGSEGIYFLPEGTTIEKIRKIVLIPETRDDGRIDGVGISAGCVLVWSGHGEVNIGEMSAAKRLALGLPVDVNHASEEDLSLIPGIGEKMAYQIVQLRNQKGVFHDLSDLAAVPGIKEKKLKRSQAVSDRRADTGTDLKSVPTIQGASFLLLYLLK